MTLSNQERVRRCQQAISAYSDDDNHTNLVDFLADVMHFCHVHGHSFASALDTARMHFEAETDGSDTLTHQLNQPKEEIMKRFRITVIVKTLEVYRVEAKNEEEAEENLIEGTLIDSDDGALENEILTIEEIKP